jgi:hypothetical protein
VLASLLYVMLGRVMTLALLCFRSSERIYVLFFIELSTGAYTSPA